KVRKAGAAIRLIGDGDIAGVIQTTNPEETGIDIYFGIGGAPEGVLAAAALRCIGGQIQTRLHPMNDQHRERAAAIGIEDIDRKYTLHDLASGDALFAATGVTNGSMLAGVRFRPSSITTETVVMRAKTHSVRWIRTQHKDLSKFA
ncbi:MAG: fructose-bisphosphatase class II, partial [Alphaproteobacteria bacterium]